MQPPKLHAERLNTFSSFLSAMSSETKICASQEANGRNVTSKVPKRLKEASPFHLFGEWNLTNQDSGRRFNCYKYIKTLPDGCSFRRL